LYSRRTSLIGLLASTAVLGGCGFRPLYQSSNSEIETVLAQIDIDPIPDRLGRDVRNALIKSLRQPATRSLPARYRLKVDLRQTVEGVAIQEDDSITRFNFRLNANFALFEKSGDVELTRGNVRTAAAYNVVDSEFATLTARRDVEERAAREIVEKIRVRLSLFLIRKDAA